MRKAASCSRKYFLLSIENTLFLVFFSRLTSAVHPHIELHNDIYVELQIW